MPLSALNPGTSPFELLSCSNSHPQAKEVVQIPYHRVILGDQMQVCPGRTQSPQFEDLIKLYIFKINLQTTYEQHIAQHIAFAVFQNHSFDL